jgi:tetratricopeptide (TPR) repeat protein
MGRQVFEPGSDARGRAEEDRDRSRSLEALRSGWAEALEAMGAESDSDRLATRLEDALLSGDAATALCDWLTERSAESNDALPWRRWRALTQMALREREAARELLLPGPDNDETSLSCWVLGAVRFLREENGRRHPMLRVDDDVIHATAACLLRGLLPPERFHEAMRQEAPGWRASRSAPGRFELFARAGGRQDTVYFTVQGQIGDWDESVVEALEAMERALPVELWERRLQRAWERAGEPSARPPAWLADAVEHIGTGAADPARLAAARGWLLEFSGAHEEAIDAYGVARAHDPELPGLLRRWASTLMQLGAAPVPLPVEELAVLVHGMDVEHRSRAVPFIAVADGRNRRVWRELLVLLADTPVEDGRPAFRRAAELHPSEPDIVAQLVAYEADALRAGEDLPAVVTALEAYRDDARSGGLDRLVAVVAPLLGADGSRALAVQTADRWEDFSKAIVAFFAARQERESLLQAAIDAAGAGDWAQANLLAQGELRSVLRPRGPEGKPQAPNDPMAVELTTLLESGRQRHLDEMRAAIDGRGNADEKGWAALEAATEEGFGRSVAGILAARSDRRERDPGLALWSARASLRAGRWDRAEALYQRAAQGMRKRGKNLELLFEWIDGLVGARRMDLALSGVRSALSMRVPDSELEPYILDLFERGRFGQPEAKAVLVLLEGARRGLHSVRGRLEPMQGAPAPWAAALEGLKLEE